MKRLLFFIALVCSANAQTVTVTAAQPLLFPCQPTASSRCAPVYVINIPRPTNPMVAAVTYRISAVLANGLAGYATGVFEIPPAGGFAIMSATFTLGGAASEFVIETAELTAIAEATVTAPLQPTEGRR